MATPPGRMSTASRPLEPRPLRGRGTAAPAPPAHAPVAASWRGRWSHSRAGRVASSTATGLKGQDVFARNKSHGLGRYGARATRTSSPTHDTAPESPRWPASPRRSPCATSLPSTTRWAGCKTSLRSPEGPADVASTPPLRLALTPHADLQGPAERTCPRRSNHVLRKATPTGACDGPATPILLPLPKQERGPDSKTT